MHWKKFKGLEPSEKRNESYFIIGLDIGDDSSSIAFYNTMEGTAETIDLSGGYGKPSIPTVMQYIPETREWVYGEYALMNRGAGADITIMSLTGRLGRHEYIEINNKPVSIINILGQFIKELLLQVKNINPKAEIVGIVAAIPSYFNSQARDEFIRAFKIAGYEKELIGLVSDRECIFTHYYATRTPSEEHALLIDYGSGQTRGGLYHIIPTAQEITIKSISSLFDETIGTKIINDELESMFRDFFIDQADLTPQGGVMEQFSAFLYQHRDVLFAKNIRNKPVKLYFNFLYPPFMQIVDYDRMEAFIRPFDKKFRSFLSDVFEKNLYGVLEVRPGDVRNIICVGGGFEMLWAKEAVQSFFGGSEIGFYKNSKIVTAEGAAIAAAQLLEAAEGQTVVVEDKHQLESDIGLISEDGKFLPLVERSTFWWQNHPVRTFIVNNECHGQIPLTVAAQNREGEIKKLMDINVCGLPARPKGTTCIGARLEFISNNDINATFFDYGFGEMFPKTDCKEEIQITLGGLK